MRYAATRQRFFILSGTLPAPLHEEELRQKKLAIMSKEELEGELMREINPCMKACGLVSLRRDESGILQVEKAEGIPNSDMCRQLAGSEGS